MSRNKGKVFERAVAAAFRLLFGAGVKRGWQAREGHDAPDVDGTPFWIEAKHHILVNIMGAMRQAVKDRKKAGDERWIVAVTKSNRTDPLATMLHSEFMQLLKEWQDSKAELVQLKAELAHTVKAFDEARHGAYRGGAQESDPPVLVVGERAGGPQFRPHTGLTPPEHP